jgi:hypothetical protein
LEGFDQQLYSYVVPTVTTRRLLQIIYVDWGREKQRAVPASPLRIIAPFAEASLGRTIGSTFEVGRRFRWAMRIDCGQLDPVAMIRPEPA